jgi:hypothetical protein
MHYHFLSYFFYSETIRSKMIPITKNRYIGNEAIGSKICWYRSITIPQIENTETMNGHICNMFTTKWVTKVQHEYYCTICPYYNHHVGPRCYLGLWGIRWQFRIPTEFSRKKRSIRVFGGTKPLSFPFPPTFSYFHTISGSYHFHFIVSHIFQKWSSVDQEFP